MRKIKRVKLLIAVGVLVIIIAVLGYFFMPGKSSTGAITRTPTVNITYSNLAPELSKNSMVKALPTGVEIVLKFYNFNSGVRKWETAFLIEKGNITVTSPDATAEIVLTLHSKYLKGLTNKNFCSVIVQANKNGDLGFETNLSSVALAWKFKSMLQYKSCLGF